MTPMVLTICRRLSLIFLFLAITAFGAPTPRLASPAFFDNSSYIDANSVLMVVTNYGLYAEDPGSLFGYSYGTFYPFTSVANIRNGTQTQSPLYSAGICLGGKVAGQTRVAVADFSAEFWPGPMAGGSFIVNADTVRGYRVFKLYADSMQTNPNQDYLNWPSLLGAPLDRFGHPLLRGTQTLWSVYNDANPGRHTKIAGSTAPLGIEVHQTTWASNRSGQERVIYIEWQFFNKGSNSITDLYVVPYFDPDLGGAEDDLTGCDTSSDIVYCYNATNADAVYGSSPPALGARLLYGPVADSPGDSAFFFGTWHHGVKNLRMSSFVGYINGDDPQSAAESYNLMQGLKRNGSPQSNGTKFSYPGDPVAGTGDLDPNPGNPHFVGSFGPIDLSPGDSQSVLIKLAIGQGADRLSSLTNLKEILNAPDSEFTNVSDQPAGVLPGNFSLDQNFPNPFNPITTIPYRLSKRSIVRLSIFDLLGRQVRVLVSGTRPAGQHEATWDGMTDDGIPVASGAYFYRLEVGDYQESRKMILVK
jgi:hypothetical protein